MTDVDKTPARVPKPNELANALEEITPEQIRLTDLAGEKIETILTRAPGNGAPIGGVKIAARHGWFAARPSGTEDVYKTYAESFHGTAHLRCILAEAQTMITNAIAGAPKRDQRGALSRCHQT